MRTTSPADGDLVDALSTLVRAWRGAGRHLPDHTPMALLQLVHLLGDGPHRLGEIAALRGIDQSVASRQIADLVDRDLARRRPDPSDGRAGLIELTPTGRALLAKADELRREVVEGALARNPATDVPAVCRFVTALADELVARTTPQPRLHGKEDPS